MLHYNSASRLLFFLIASFAMLAPASTAAFDKSVYADSSRLAEGRWVKISVDKSGLYLITTADLRRCGFSKPENVRVFGYGGARIADALTLANYVDDLSPAPCEATSKGLVFWGQGPERWTESTIKRGQFIHSLNPYSTSGFYFLTEVDTPAAMAVDGDAVLSESAATTFIETDYHELDQTSPGQSGHLLVGEDFRFNKSQTFQFPLTGSTGASGFIECRFTVNSTNAATLAFTANGAPVDNASSMRINPSSASAYAATTVMRFNFPLPDSPTLALGLNFQGGATTPGGAWLDAISFNYEREIKLNGGSLCFSTDAPYVALSGISPSAQLTVWDVTDPGKPFAVNASTPDNSGRSGWASPYTGRRRYAAWTADATLPSPTIVETISNQNIHGHPVPDMVIITPADWKAQAQRLADYHSASTDSLRVLVVTDTEVYNEFSSGTPDIGAFRRMLKMFWDRSEPAAPHRLRYALLMGRATYDNRLLTNEMRMLGQRILPCWQTDDGLRESTSYMTDDFLAFLDDNSGSRISSDTLRIGVGRLPVGTTDEARQITDKLLGFYSRLESDTKSGLWKNHVVLTADDGDNGVHMDQAEMQYNFMVNSTGGRNMTYTKVYIDAYDEVGGESVIGRQQLHRALQNGVAWWNYIGHGNTQRLGSEGLIIYNDLNELRSKYPAFFYGATCSFLRWDGTEKSACELLMHNPSGGIIGAICPTREVYISENEYMSNAIAREAFSRRADGRAPTVGDIMKQAKNSLTDKYGTPIKDNLNKLRYVLMADPAMRLATPEPIVRLERINGMALDNPELQPTIQARQAVTLEGGVYDPTGRNLLSDFNGSLNVELYDAEQSVTTQGRPSDDTNGERVTYEEQGSLLYAGCDSVRDGRFALKFNMPAEIADNFRPATLSMYARSATDSRQAAGADRSFYVYGFDESAEPDTIAPAIDYAYLNHSSFADGDVVNPSPMFIAAVSDNCGINLSTAGVGHQLSLKIDDRDSYNDLSTYYTPASNGSPAGTIAYPLDNLTEGYHQLNFRVWDTAGNSSSHSFGFNVRNGLAPALFDVYTDANPATTAANFYLSHNRPDQIVTVTVEVFNLNGRLEWSQTVTDQSDMFLSAPITWNLCDMAGHRVNRGIYLYRATVTADGQASKSMAKRIAVGAP